MEENTRNNLSERLLDFAVGIVKMAMKLFRSPAERHIGKQITRFGTSVGANYEEACGGESRADFVHKLQIVLKELRERVYWLRVIDKAELISKEREKITWLLKEGTELTKIMAKSIVTTKSKII